MILIADSGSTKTSWITIENGKIGEVTETAGINPVRDSESTIKQTLCQLNGFAKGEVEKIFFYGAGCILPYSDHVRCQLQMHFPEANEIQVESDMLGAAIALCGHQSGIACILGTGANSCLFDGERIIQQTPALGFILGDEGSGASLGKKLVGDIFKTQAPVHICKAFFEETGLTQQQVIDHVYRQPMPNKFLASLVPFLSRHCQDPYVDEFVTNEFRCFLNRNIKNYNRPDLPINFVGGITEGFREQLAKAISLEGLKLGKIIQKPISAMADYHIQVTI